MMAHPKTEPRSALLELEVRTGRSEELVDITERVEETLSRMGLREGLALVYVPHTTAGVTINEGADPDVRRDMLVALDRIVPAEGDYRHAEGNSPAHLKASLMGSSAIVPVEGGRLKLGRWQSVYLCEFDGPRSRKVWVSAGGRPSSAK